MKKKVIMTGPFLSQSGYGYQARFALEALRSAPDKFEIFIHNTEWGQTSWLHEDDELRRYIDETIKKTILHQQSGGGFDVHLQVSIPNEITPKAPINVLYTAGIETTKVSPQWLDKIRQLNSMIVVSNHSKQIFESTSYPVQDQNGNPFTLGCNTKINVVNYCVPKGIKSTKPKIDLEYDFNFLSVAQWSPRKNMHTLIDSFVREFHDAPVGLVLKTSVAAQNVKDRMIMKNRLDAIKKSLEGEFGTLKCKIYLLHGDVSNEEMRGLYKHPKIKALVSTAHGEGFGLPMFEAAYSSLPVITHGWSGQADFLYIGREAHFVECDYNILPIDRSAVWPGVLEENSQWAYIKPDSFRSGMRSAYTDYDSVKKVAKKLQKHLLSEFTEEKMYGMFVDAIMSHFELDDDEIDAWLNDMVFVGDNNEENKEEEE